LVTKTSIDNIIAKRGGSLGIVDILLPARNDHGM
jgi:hypothetical protein